MTSKERLKKQDDVYQILIEVNFLPFQECLKDQINYDLNKKFEIIKKIGAGSYGTAYAIEQNSIKFIIKESTITSNDEKKQLDKSYNLNKLLKESYTEEYRIMNKLRDEIILGCPNFILAYEASACDTYDGDTKTRYFMSIMESAICDLGEFESRYPINDELIWSITYQLFISLSILHLKYGIYHKDIKKQNVLVLRVKPGGYFRYIMNDKEYFVKNHGYLFCLHDFGLSIDFKSQEMKGARNAKVRDDGKLEPITCEYELQYNTETRRFFVDKETDPMKVKWVDGDKIITGTYNLTLNERVKPTIPVDTKDFVHFPMMEFFNDIQNLLGTIAGTRDAYVYRYNYKTELYDHLALEDISNKIIEKFRKVQPLDSSFPYDTSSAIYLRADMMLDYLYEEPDNIDNIEVCDLFVCNF